MHSHYKHDRKKWAGGARGQSATPDSEKFAKNREQEGKKGKIGKKRQKSGRFFHIAPPDR